MPHRSTAGVEEGFGAVRPIVWKAHGSECLCVIQIQVEVAAFPRRGVVLPVSFSPWKIKRDTRRGCSCLVVGVIVICC